MLPAGRLAQNSALLCHMPEPTHMGGLHSQLIEASAQLVLFSIVSNITSVDRTIAPQSEL